MDDDEIIYQEEDEPPPPREPWPILIVDDDEAVHLVTKLALERVEFLDRPVAFTSATSGAEARSLLESGAEFALIIVDVVMETEDAGLRLVRYVREELENRRSRIILRTGQPGQAPEQRIIVDFDINDYKSKVELTRDRLFVAVIASLRAYGDIMAVEQARRQLEQNRAGLIRIIDAAPAIFGARSVEALAQGALEQLQSLVCPDGHMSFTRIGGAVAVGSEATSRVVAATGRYAGTVGRPLDEAVDPALLPVIEQALADGAPVLGGQHFVALVRTESGERSLLIVDGVAELPPEDVELVNRFCGQVGRALELVGRA